MIQELFWNDGTLNIPWPLKENDLSESTLSLSEKDKKLQTFCDFINNNLK